MSGRVSDIIEFSRLFKDWNNYEVGLDLGEMRGLEV